MIAASHPTIIMDYLAYTNQGFLLREVSFAAEGLLSGVSETKLRRQVLHEDAFQLRASPSRKTILGAVLSRLQGVPADLLMFLAEGSLELRKLTNLYLFLLKHRLLREFIAEQLREDLLRFEQHLKPAEVSAFFERKRDQVPEVGAWSELTLRKSRSNILTTCVGAGLLSKAFDKTYKIEPQFVPNALRNELVQAGRETFLPLLLDRASL